MVHALRKYVHVCMYEREKDYTYIGLMTFTDIKHEMQWICNTSFRLQ